MPVQYIPSTPLGTGKSTSILQNAGGTVYAATNDPTFCPLVYQLKDTSDTTVITSNSDISFNNNRAWGVGSNDGELKIDIDNLMDYTYKIRVYAGTT